MFPLSAHRHPGTGPGHPQRRTGRSKTCFLLWPAPCCMAGKTSLTRTACLPSWMPPQPVVGGEPPGTCQRDSRGTPPDPFACVSCRKKPIAIFCRVEVLDPARQFSFCRRGRRFRPPGLSLFWTTGLCKQEEVMRKAFFCPLSPPGQRPAPAPPGGGGASLSGDQDRPAAGARL